MAYIVLTTKDGDEIERREVAEALSIGRSAECAIRLHDILLSRVHCCVETDADNCVVIDLDSRNGTTVNGRRIERHTLHDCDRIVVGTTHAIFHEGPMVPSESKPRSGLLDRPADPFEALSATVTDFEFDPKFEPPVDRPIIRPTPRPMPVASKMRRQESAVAVASSPTWSPKPANQSPRPTVEVYLRELPKNLPEIEIVSQKKRWRARAFWTIAEALLLSALTGAGVLALLYVLPGRVSFLFHYFNR